ncbi:histone-lysine N-methyltransferase 2D-like isoform X4 [Daktulosphaira vitifoliae]|uniref:histone-lysine N-methyltransferase 2D-like isoform X4 n=1 Tax=Daktulosphaira vitifoliae TaxID=58002 RepID=UPI0021AAB2BB|nr:histone-lysine N-methyltransferase 2D-like isoform X4 [Daktulosphaira vitifoliae]
MEDKLKMSKTSVDKSEEMDLDDQCSDEDIDNGVTLLEEDDDDDDDDDDDEDDDDNEDMDDDPDYQEEDSRVSAGAASINVEENTSNITPMEIHVKTESNFEETSLCSSVGNTTSLTTYSNPSLQMKKLNLKIKRWRREDTEGKSPSVSRVEEIITPISGADPIVDDRCLLYQENWPGKVCAFCNLGERSQLGQGTFLRLEWDKNFKLSLEEFTKQLVTKQLTPMPLQSPTAEMAPTVHYRRQKSAAKIKQQQFSTSSFEPVDELSVVGHLDVPDINSLFEQSESVGGYMYVHQFCATWTQGVKCETSDSLENVPELVLESLMRRCSYCGHLGASAPCTYTNCLKFFHYPCIFASASFQEMSVPALICSSHLDHVPLMELSANVACGICSTLGDVSNLMMCTVCGNHFHGVCIGLALYPGVRAGWQCGNCRTCQVCRQPAEQTKVMLCEGCDKAYHPGCLRPQVTTIPKIGWKCKCCRICTDCGSRTPGAGLSSRWHAHYTVCDSCYQQRNKGSSCPLCHRAYRAAAHREMVQCIACRKYIHGACDPEAEYITSHSKNSASDYMCPLCKNAVQRRRDGFDEYGDSNSSMDVFQLADEQDSEFKSSKDFEDNRVSGYGLGKGKPYAASKIAKKRLLLSAYSSRAKGLGKLNAALKPIYQKKGQRLADFPRKRPRGRMRGIFGVPGLGLQRPLSDLSSKCSPNEIDPNNENRIVLCSAKDKFVLGQDICVMCGSLGTDQEACLISCSQCGQCYHPFCVNVKITKVILQKGWRCLDCTICEGCGQRNDESRLILCDECDISYHIYCTEPKLDYVPRGTWKCKWCSQCLTCGSNDPGINCIWLNNYTECGPCASRSTCPSCQETYLDNQLIIKCYQCDRWLHGKCDKIENEEDAEKCAEDSYICLLCRPRGSVPPHLNKNLSLKTKLKASSRENSPDCLRGIANEHYMDGIYLSECGVQHMKHLNSGIEVCHQRKKRKDWKKAQSEKEAAIMAAIESVVCSSRDTINDSAIQPDDAYKMDFDDMKEELTEPEPVYKEGMEIQPREDGRPPEPPEGFSIVTLESGVMVLRRKRVRNLQKLGIGGFVVRGRMPRSKDKDEENTQEGDGEENKPRRKPNRWKKPKSKIAENYPNYIQDAFFGRDLLDACSVAAQILDSSESEEINENEDDIKTIELSQAELKIMEDIKAKQITKEVSKKCSEIKVEEVERIVQTKVVDKKSDIVNSNDQDALKDILLSDNLLDSIMNERNSNIKTEMEVVEESNMNEMNSSAQKDEFSEILGSHFNLDSMVRETGLPNMDSKDVEEIFKVVLTDDASQEAQDPNNSNMLIMNNNNVNPINHGQNGVVLTQNQSHPPIMSPSRTGLPTNISRGKVPAPALPPVVTNISSSPIYTTGMSPYHSEYSNSPSQFSPAFSEPHSPWIQNSGGEDSLEGIGSQSTALNNNQRNSQKMEADETLGHKASISAVLYANLTHPEWKKEFPSWPERSRQILKKWRTLSPEQKAPFLLKARENRTNLRQKKAQQIMKDDNTSSDNRTSSTSSATQSPTINNGEDQDKMMSQQRTREAENERQWKQLQAMRQQQAQAVQQQQVVQDQRGQVYQRVPVQQRNLSIDTNQFGNSDQQVLVHTSHLATQLQVSTNQDGSLTPLQSPSSITSQQQSRSPYPSPVLKVTRVVSPASASPSPQYTRAQPTPGSTDLFSPPISTSSVVQQQRSVHFSPTSPRAREDVFSSPQANQEMTRHLRELLQRQQFKKDLPTDQRLWNSEESQNQELNTQNVQSQDFDASPSSGPTFRQPLPPSAVKIQRMPFQQMGAPNTQMIIRQRVTDPKFQLLDPRFRLLIQQQRSTTGGAAVVNSNMNSSHFNNSGIKSPITQQALTQQNTRAYEIIQHSQQHFSDTSDNNVDQKYTGINEVTSVMSDPNSITQNTSMDRQNNVLQQQNQQNSMKCADTIDSRNEEMPDGVSEELEKLQQEGDSHNIGEVDGVNALLGDLDDDDELLAEMGADFNILEYADPELDNLDCGNKTNILYDLVDDEETSKSTHNKPVSNDKSTDERDIKLKEETDGLQRLSNLNDRKNDNNVPQTLSIEKYEQEVPHSPKIENPSNVGSHLQMNQEQNSQLNNVMQNRETNVNFMANFSGDSNQSLPKIATIASGSVPQQQRLLQMQRTMVPNRSIGVTPQILPQGNSQVRQLAPPPPYPGPPPPYPGHNQEQPLLLEELLEQEKREQEKRQNSDSSNVVSNVSSSGSTLPALMSDADFELLRADVMNSSTSSNAIASPPIIQHGGASGVLQHQISDQLQMQRQTYVQRPTQPSQNWNQVQQIQGQSGVKQQFSEQPLKVPIFNAPVLTPPPQPPDVIATEQDRQLQHTYEVWLNEQSNIVTKQLKHYESEVQKLRKMKKSMNSKQRVARKQGNELSDHDTIELQRITAEQQVLQKLLETSRKQNKQHMAIVQEYKNKHRPATAESPQSPNVMMSPSSTGSIHQQQNSMSPHNTITTPLSQCDENPYSPNNPQSLPSPRASLTSQIRNPGQSSPRLSNLSPSNQDQLSRHPGMTPIRFVRSPDGLTLRARPTLVSLQGQMPSANTSNTYQGSKVVTNVTISQNSQVQQSQPRLTFQQLTPQQQQLILQRKLAQKAILISQQQQELSSSSNQDPVAVQQRQMVLSQHRQLLLQQIEQIQKQMNDGQQNQQQRQILVQQAVVGSQDGKTELTPQQRQQIVIQRQNIILQQQQQFQQLQQQNIPQQQQNISQQQQNITQQQQNTPQQQQSIPQQQQSIPQQQQNVPQQQQNVPQQQQFLQSQNNPNQLHMQTQNSQNAIQLSQPQQQILQNNQNQMHLPSQNSQSSVQPQQQIQSQHQQLQSLQVQQHQLQSQQNQQQQIQSHQVQQQNQQQQIQSHQVQQQNQQMQQQQAHQVQQQIQQMQQQQAHQIQQPQQQQQMQQNQGQKLFQHQQLQIQLAKQQHIMAQHNAQIQQKLVQRSPQQQNMMQAQLSPQQQSVLLQQPQQQIIKQEPGEIVNPNILRQQQQQQQQILLQRQQQSRFLQQQLISQGKVTRQIVQSQQQSPIHPPQSPNQPPLSPMPQSPVPNNQQYCQPNSPMISAQSPMLSQSPQQFPQPVQSPNSVQYTPNSPMPSQSPRHNQFVQSTTSPLMPQSPMLQTYANPPATSPFTQPPPSSPSPRPSQSPRNNLGPPSSPMSPMQQNPYIRPTTSPMSARRTNVGSSPLMTDQQQQQQQQQELREDINVPSDGYQYTKLGLRGGKNFIPPKDFYYSKLGLRGGVPMWSTGRQFVNKDTQDEVTRSVFKSNDMPLNAIPVSKVSSLVSLEYGDSDDEESRTPPITTSSPSPLQISKQKEAPEGINTDPMIISTSPKNEENRNLPVYKDVNLLDNCKKDSSELDDLQMISTIHMTMDPGQISLNSSRVGEELLEIDREINSPSLLLNENDDSILGGLPKDEASEMNRLMFFDELGDSIKCDQEEKSGSPEKPVFNLDKLLNDPEPLANIQVDTNRSEFHKQDSKDSSQEKVAEEKRSSVNPSYSFHSYAKIPKSTPSLQQSVVTPVSSPPLKKENHVVSVLKTDQTEEFKKVTDLLRSHGTAQNKNIIILNHSDTLKEQHISKQNVLLAKSENLKNSDLAQILSNIMSPKQKDGFIKIETTKSDDNIKHSTIVLPTRTTSVLQSPSQNFPWESITSYTTTTSSSTLAKSIQIISKSEEKESKTFSQLPIVTSASKQDVRTPKIVEESQNVLLKQLLQNTACANQTPTSNAISLPIVPSLEAQLARPVSPTPPLLFPSLLSPKKEENESSNTQVSKAESESPKSTNIITQQSEILISTTQSSTSLNTLPSQPQQQSQLQTQSNNRPDLQQSLQTPSLTISQSQTQPQLLTQSQSQDQVQIQSLQSQTLVQSKLQISDKTLTRPQTQSLPARTLATTDSIMESINAAIKQEQSEDDNKIEVPVSATRYSPEKDVKKELMSSDELISPQNSTRNVDPTDIGNQINIPIDIMNVDPQDQKRIKRRQYYAKRRQSQGKDVNSTVIPKKRHRKGSKPDEDYDSFIDVLMSQLRQLQPMSVIEPSLNQNLTACPVYGIGDIANQNDFKKGDLKGEMGLSTLSGESDYYNTKPFGDLLPVSPLPQPSTQRGFYNEEFIPLKFESDNDEKKFEVGRDRDDTPDTIMSSSSPELVACETPPHYPGLKCFDDDSDSTDTLLNFTRNMSPVHQLVAPLALKPRPNYKFSIEDDKENQGGRPSSLTQVGKTPPRTSPVLPLRDSNTMTVTLTITSEAADDIIGVLQGLATLLDLPDITNYKVTERSVTPMSHKLGLYRSKTKDGKEGTPIDIQTILNGFAKFCRHCDLVILNNLVKKKASEIPFLITEECADEIYFCSTLCFQTFASLLCPPSESKDKAITIVNHLSEGSPPKRLKSDCESRAILETEIVEKMDIDEPILNEDENKNEAIIDDGKATFKGTIYRRWNTSSVPAPSTKHKKTTDKELMEMLFRMGITVISPKQPEDKRMCLFCHQLGDGVSDGPSRLLNFDVDKWVHLNCALWSDDVYETVNGALIKVDIALRQSLSVECIVCQRPGATLKCFKHRCSSNYHLPCAVKDDAVFYKNKTLYCSGHAPKSDKENELTTLSVHRRVYIDRDENRQVAAVMHHSSSHQFLIRVGSLTLLNIGQLLPHQLNAFHTSTAIYPIGFKVVRLFWSMRVPNKRCRYICSIHEINGRPEFRIVIQEADHEDLELKDSSPRAVWSRVLSAIASMRIANNILKLHPQHVSGDSLFGLTEPAIVRILESLPGVETLTDYRFRYGRNPLLELPLAVNPSGCARCEGRRRVVLPGKLRSHIPRSFTSSHGSSLLSQLDLSAPPTCPYSKHFVHSKSSQYKKMKQEWRNNVYLARSKIQGLGLYAARDLEKHTMVIEYIGEIIRSQLCDYREKLYEAKNRGIYMFRLDDDRVVDATISGGLARYINHSCNPNCVTEKVEVDRELRIIIFAKRRIARGEELAYDYQFDIEDDQHKIPCNCGAPNCRKWMN